jgi:hypothetical protein
VSVIGNAGGRTQFGTPERGKSAASRPAQGRVCDHEGCATILSTYNATGTCFVHADAPRRPPLARA